MSKRTIGISFRPMSAVDTIFKSLLLPQFWSDLLQTFTESSLGGPSQKNMPDFGYFDLGIFGEFFRGILARLPKSLLLPQFWSDLLQTFTDSSLGGPSQKYMPDFGYFDFWIFGEFLPVLGGIWLDHQKAYSSLSFDRIFLKLSQNVPGMIPPKSICQIFDILILKFLIFCPPPHPLSIS